MNENPRVKVIFDRRKTARSSRPGCVEIEIYLKRKRKWIATGVSVLPKNWSDKKRVVGRMDSKELNRKIEKIETSILDTISKFNLSKTPITWDLFSNNIGGQIKSNSFIEFVKKRIEERNDITESTRKNHRKLLVALDNFDKIHSFSDLSKRNILLYDEWLHGRKSYTQSTIASYHKFMKVYINEAIRHEHILVNPYEGMKIDRGKSAIRKYLRMEEVKQLEEVQLTTLSLEKTRDIFIFQCYTGLAYADLVKFDFSKVIESNGKYILHDVRQKTGEDYYIVLLPTALQILKKYDFKLPLMTNQQYNMRLKIVADSAGLKVHLTSHMGRHTYASLCINNGIKLEVIAKMLGHSDVKTTQIYASMVNKTVEKAYEELAEKLS